MVAAVWSSTKRVRWKHVLPALAAAASAVVLAVAAVVTAAAAVAVAAVAAVTAAALAVAAVAVAAAAAVVTAVAVAATKQLPENFSNQKRTLGSFFVACTGRTLC